MSEHFNLRLVALLPYENWVNRYYYCIPYIQSNQLSKVFIIHNHVLSTLHPDSSPVRSRDYERQEIHIYVF